MRRFTWWASGTCMRSTARMYTSRPARPAAPTLMITARILLASALLAGVSWAVWFALDSLLGRSLVAQIVSVGAAGLAGLLVYMRAVLRMHVPEAQQVNRLIRTQFGRA